MNYNMNDFLSWFTFISCMLFGIYVKYTRQR